MKKILYVIAVLLLMCGSCNETSSSYLTTNKDTTANYDTIFENKSVIQYFIDLANSDNIVDSELITIYERINRENPQVIRGAERDLDTTVNHHRYIFKTAKPFLGEHD